MISSTAKRDIKEKLGINVIYKKTGTLKNREDVFNVANYQLSHCAIKKNKHSLKWFGELSYRKVSNSELKKFRDLDYIEEDAQIEKSKSCEICSLRLVPARLVSNWKEWANFMPDDEDMNNGCVFPSGLLVIVRFDISEKMAFYDDDYNRLPDREPLEPRVIEVNTRFHRIDGYLGGNND